MSPILGVVERPEGETLGPAAVLPDGRVLVSGWAFDPAGTPVRVRARVEPGAWVECAAQRVRDDVGLAHPEVAEAGRSGFVLLVPAPAGPGGGVLCVEARSGSGAAVLDRRPIALPPPGEPPIECEPLFRPPVRRSPPAATPIAPHVLFVSHNFNLEGAPRSLLDLARRLGGEGMPLRVLGPAEGPLAPRWREAGVAIELVGDPGRLPALDDYRARLRRLAALEARFRPDLVFANTLDTFWAVDLAAELGVPAIWVIRESVDVETYFLERWPFAIARRALDALSGAARVVFVARATASLFEGFVPRDRLVVIPNGLDFDAIDGVQAGVARSAARRRLGLPQDASLVVCVGTTCQRKGQRTLIEALGRWTGPRPLVALVGVRDGDYLDVLARRVASLGLAGHVRFVHELPDPSPWYRAADVFACPSYEESLPRVVIEAMAFGLPVVASAVNGIPELIADGVHGSLVPAGDADALAAGLRRWLDDPAAAARAGEAGGRRARSVFGIDRMVDSYARLVREVA